MIYPGRNKAAVYSNYELHPNNPLDITPPRHLGIEEILPDKATDIDKKFLIFTVVVCYAIFGAGTGVFSTTFCSCL